jgi:peptide chain release factor subunit 1
MGRLSVVSAITSTQQRLKGYTTCPENGLVVLVGDVLTDEGKERKLAVDFEPLKPMARSLYMCDSRFHVELLMELMQDEDAYGFIVMDGNGSLFGTVQGNVRKVLRKFAVHLPKKHGRGGQSSARFGRIRLEKRHNYVRLVAEAAC